MCVALKVNVNIIQKSGENPKEKETFFTIIMCDGDDDAFTNTHKKANIYWRKTCIMYWLPILKQTKERQTKVE